MAHASVSAPRTSIPACGLPELWQAEWCPHSQRVRTRLTEVGSDFVSRQVPAGRERRVELVERTGSETVPVLITGEGETIAGAEAIVVWLDTHYAAGLEAEAHRRKAAEKHRELLDRECNCHAA